MQLPELRLPVRGHGLRPRAPTRPRELARWAESLPQGDGERTAAEVLERLRSLNLHSYGPHQRATLMAVVRPLAEDVLAGLHRPLLGASVPLDARRRRAASDIQQILEELAHAEKLIISALAVQRHLRPSDLELLKEATYRAVAYLAHRLVECYGIYANEPPGVWRELHHLFRFAEAHDLHTDLIEGIDANSSPSVGRCIEHAYKRIVLLSIAEPYHLMAGEAAELYKVLEAWAGGCQMLPLGGLPPNGEFVVDFAVDMAPRFVSRDLLVRPVAGRILDISEPKAALESVVRQLLRRRGANGQGERIGLAERQRRDMFMRLSDAWAGNPSRHSPRHPRQAELQVAIGLNACHYQISAGAPFTPEMDALKIATSMRHPGMAHGSARPREEETPHGSFAQAYRDALEKDRRHQPRKPYEPQSCLQINQSGDGIGLRRPLGGAVPVSVGELAAYRRAGASGTAWRIGVIRWLHAESEGALEMGVRNLANRAVAVGVKGLAGIGAGGGYFRGLLLPPMAAGSSQATLLTPASIFDVGSVLQVIDRRQLRRLQLTRIVLSTRAFNEFEFRPAGNGQPPTHTGASAF
ncbi:MAG: hypothetical protein P8009_07770 [Gammaproteobacteria bacterium]